MTAGEAVTQRVTAPGDIERARRRWRADRVRYRRRLALAFDAHLDRMYGLDEVAAQLRSRHEPQLGSAADGGCSPPSNIKYGARAAFALVVDDAYDGDYWRDCGMHLGVAERERAA